MFNQKIIDWPIADLKPYDRNARTHSGSQIDQLSASIRKFGFNNPILVSDEGEIIAGHGRVIAAGRNGLKSVPAIILSHLTAAERRAYRLADNKHALNAGWDNELLAIELQYSIDEGFEVAELGWTMAESDFLIEGAEESLPSNKDLSDDRVPDFSPDPVSCRGDLWQLGRHRLLCGDALDAADLAQLMEGESAQIAFLDPPWNVRVNGHVSSGKGKKVFAEFAYASGEMKGDEFTEFLTKTLANNAAHMVDGAIAYVCIDWRHFVELHTAGHRAFDELKNVIVWNKGTGANGSFYRSQHELILVFKKGSAEHINSFGLGQTGRYRTNLWTHAGMASFGPDRNASLAMHPTVKPVALVADALRDCSRRGDIVIDSFGGSGSTLIAAEKTGRKARLIEFEPIYCDTIVRRWQQFTGKAAILIDTGETFEARELAVRAGEEK